MRTFETAIVVVSLFVFALTDVARAEPEWVVVSVRTTGSDPAALTEALEGALTTSGDRVVAGREAATRFERLHSADATTVEPGDIEVWASRSRAALRHLARAEYTEARRALLQAQAISERAAEAMNREATRARGVLDTCLMVVRTQLETGNEAAALEQARACRRLVPRMQATAYTHPPEVRELLTRVDAEPAADVGGMVRIESAPSGCPVRVNGDAFGTTPVATNELGAGEYRVQVECRGDAPGRVRRIVVGPTDVFVRVDARLDEALRSRGGLSLVYDGASSADEHAVHDAGFLANALGVRVLLVRVTTNGNVRLDAIASSGVRVLEVPRLDVLEQTGEVLTRLAQREEDDPVEIDDMGPAAPSGLSSLPRARRRLGLSLLGAGTAALVTGIALEARRESLGAHYEVALPSDVDFLDRQLAWARFRTPLLAVSTAGGALTSTSIVLLASHHRRLPWWAVSAGVAGVGISAWAIASSVGLPRCDGSPQDVPDCVARETLVDRASLLASLASPLLTTPLALKLRREVSVSASASRGQLAFSIQGVLP